jgi:Matrixin
LARSKRAGRLLKLLPILLSAVVAALAAAPDDASVASARRTPIEQQVGLRPGLQLAAMRSAIAAAPDYFDGFNSGCSRTMPVLAYQGGDVMAGNFRGQDAGCYVWLNLSQASLLTAREICKLTLHEMGHLTGLQHSSDPSDVMYAPFVSDPIPGPCVRPLATASASTRR